MDNPWLLVIMSVAVILVIVRLAAVFMNVVAERAIGSKHRAAQVIIETGKVPPQWVAAGGGDAARRAALARLDALIEHFKTSPLVEDEETRQILLGKLGDARQAWQARPWHEIT